MLLDGIISLLTANTTVNGLVRGRVYMSLLPRGYRLPAIALHRYGGTQDYEFDGPVGVREDQVQIDVYGDTVEDCQTTIEAVRSTLVGYVGTLPDGTVVQACYLEREMDMPYLPHADQKAVANRTLLGFRFVTTRV